MNSIYTQFPLICRYLRIKDLLELRCVSRQFFVIVNRILTGKYSNDLCNFDLVLREKRPQSNSFQDLEVEFLSSRWFSSDANNFNNERTDTADFMQSNSSEELLCTRPLIIDHIGNIVRRLKLIFNSTTDDSTILFNYLTKFKRLEQLDLHLFELVNKTNVLEHPTLKILYINDSKIKKGSSFTIDCPNLEILHMDLARREFRLVHKSQLKYLSNLYFGIGSSLDLSGYKSLETLECNRIKEFNLDQLTKLANLREFIIRYPTMFNIDRLIQFFSDAKFKSLIHKIDIYLTDKQVFNMKDCQDIFNRYRWEIQMPLKDYQTPSKNYHPLVSMPL